MAASSTRRLPDPARGVERRTAAVSGGQRITPSIGLDRSGGVLWRNGCRSWRSGGSRSWRRKGLPARLIGKEIGRAHRTVWSNIRLMRRPPVPEPVRSPLRLSLTEREEISRGLAGGESLRSIARRLGRSPSTISREVERATVACAAIGRVERIRMRCVVRGGRSQRSSRCVGGCGRWSRRSSSCVGLRSRSRVGWWRSSPTIRRCACRTRRSTCRCSCSRAARYARN